MSKQVYKVATAMFDIKPINHDGNVDVSKIYNIQSVINLGRKFRIKKNGEVSLKNQKPAKNARFGSFTEIRDSGSSTYNKYNKSVNHVKFGVDNLDTVEVGGVEPPRPWLTSRVSYPSTPTVAPVYQEKLNPQDELNKYLNEELDSTQELALMGVKIVDGISFKPRYNSRIKNYESRVKEKETISQIEPEEIIPVLIKEDSQDLDFLFQEALAQINRRVREGSLSVDYVEDYIENIIDVEDGAHHDVEKYDVILTDLRPRGKNLAKLEVKLPKLSRIWVLVAVTSFLGLTLFGHYGFSLQKKLVAEGNSAVAKLENAGENIKNMDFVSASSNFAQAYQEFSKAGDNMNFMGAGISSLLSDLPGAGKLKSAKNLVEAGKLMANAGQAMSDAMGEISKTNLILLPTSQVGYPQVSNSNISIGEISASLKKALTLSKKNLGKAKQLLANVDDSSIPEDKKATFEEFKSKLPFFEKLVNDSVDYSKFLEDFIGTKGTKKYLILFQNPSELRPTGGFPGTYGVVSFKDGKLQDLKVDDVYNLDGQLQELIIPPVQLQHITPNWGMRDANWFVDFPTSARKITAFFKKESGYDIDGVITFSPKIVASILDIVGPVEMPEYDLTLDSSNLLTALQDEVEYNGDRKQPKQVVMDLAPKMLEKLYSAEPGKWLDVFNVLVSSMERKDILMYFRDLNLESFSVDKGFSGKIADVASDYLMVTFTNVKGSKTDSVVDSSLKVQTTTESGDVKHKVSITRTHNGGGSEYGFYNKQSPTYVRVLVPNSAEFVGLTGNSRPNFKPLIDYANSGFKKDEDLDKFEEESYRDKETGVTIYKEAGKTEFGFWMIINPGETKTVDLEYTVPSSGEGYQFYIQKQPSLDISDFKFYVDNELYFDGPLDKDMVISPK